MKHQWLIRIASLVGLVAAGVVFARWQPEPTSGPMGNAARVPDRDGPPMDPLMRDEGRVTWLVRRERWDEAISLANDVLTRAPERTGTLWNLAAAHARRDQPGDAEASLAAYARLNELATRQSAEYRSPDEFRRLGLIRHRLGDEPAAREAYAKAASLQRWYINGRAANDVPDRWWYNLACLEALAGNVNAAFDALDEAIERGFTNAEYAQSDSDFDAIRSDPRFAKALQAMRDRVPDEPETADMPR